MTTQTSTQISLFHQIAAFFAGPDTVRQPAENTQGTAQRTAVKIVAPLVPPTHLLGDGTDGDEPADLALVDLIPPGLTALNLPHYKKTQAQETQALDEQIGPACLINACQLEDRPLTEAEMETAELEELIPTDLKKLNIARAKAAILLGRGDAIAMEERRVTPTPLPDLAKLQRANSIAQSTELQNAA